MSNQRGERFEIIDSRALSHLIGGAVDRRFGGSRRRAAFEACGLEPPTADLALTEVREMDAARKLVDRVVGEATRRISRRSVERLERLLDVDEVAQLWRLVLTPEGQRALTAHNLWIARELGLLDDSDVADAVRTIERAGLEWLRKRCPDLIEEFDDFLVKRGHYQLRADLALRSLVEPLLQHLQSAGVERSLLELTDEELRRYVRATLDRQKMLLGRAPDRERAQQAPRLIVPMNDHLGAAYRLAVSSYWDPRAFAGPGASELLDDDTWPLG